MRKEYYTLITGASEGLGKAMAIECAGRKMNLVLVALPGPELHSLARFIRRNYHVEVIVFEKDLCKEDSCTELVNEINGLNLQVNILINNAGIGGTFLFEEQDVQFYERLIKLNVLATTLLTRLLIENLKRCPDSYILNVSSMANYFYLPKKHIYGASKAFIYSFSRSLEAELKKDNVHVTVLCPGGINTNVAVTLLNKTNKWLARMSILNPEQVAPLAINGLLKKKRVIIPGRINKLFLVMNKMLPGFVKRMVINMGMKNLNSTNPMTRYMNIKPTVVPVQETIT